MMPIVKHIVFQGADCFKKKDAWKQESLNKIRVVAELTAPYKMKTKNGFKDSTAEQITVYYEEKI